MIRDYTKLARVLAMYASHGLPSGMGREGEPGGMCAEALICYALGEPFGDKPSCVPELCAIYAASLNDRAWSTEAARAAGMLPVMVCQLGSMGVVDEVAWCVSVDMGVAAEVRRYVSQRAADPRTDTVERHDEHLRRLAAVQVAAYREQDAPGVAVWDAMAGLDLAAVPLPAAVGDDGRVLRAGELMEVA